MGRNLLDLVNINNSKESMTKIKKDIANKDIAIIGISARLPKAENVDKFWENIKNNVDCLMEFPKERRDDADRSLKYANISSSKIGMKYCKAAYLDSIDKFDYNYFNISPKEASLMDPNQRIFLEESIKAIEDSGYGGEKLMGTRTGVFLGYKFDEYYDYKKLILDVEPQSVLRSFNGNLTAITPSRLSYLLDLRGPSLLVETACSSALVAVHLACKSILNKECDMAVAAGLKISLVPIETTDKLGIESSDGRARTFDERADGTGMGEGAISIILKPLSKAIRDKDNIYTVIKGSSMNQDGRSIGLTAPNVLAQEDLIDRAWQDAEVEPESIGYIETHGTATNLGDPIEIDGIQRAFRRYTDKKQFCAVGSVKTNIGHLDNAAGIAGLLQAVMALKNKYIPPVYNFKNPNKKINFINSPVYVNDKLKKWDTNEYPRRCGISSFGFSGTNCHVVLEENQKKDNIVEENRDELRIFTLSAKTKKSLDDLISEYQKFVNIKNVNIDDLCYTANTGRGHYEYRIIMIVKDYDDLKNKINNIKYEENNSKNVFFGEHKTITNNIKELAENEVTEIMIQNLSLKANDVLNKICLSEQEDINLLNELCNLYIQGAKINFEELYKDEKPQKISIPVYQFEKNRCWVNFKEESNNIDLNSFYYKNTWRKVELYSEKNNEFGKGTLIVLKDNKKISDELIEKLNNYNNDIIQVEIGEKFNKLDNKYYIVSNCIEDYEKVFSMIQANNAIDIIHMHSITEIDDVNSLEEIQYEKDRGVLSLLHLIKAVGKSDNKINLYLITENSYKVTKEQKTLKPQNSMLIGLGKSIHLEYPNISCRCIDIDKNIHMEMLIKELTSKSNEYLTCYRNDARYIELVEKLNDIKREDKYTIKGDGIYIVTGGTGGIGGEICEKISKEHKTNIAILTRSKFPKENEWENLIKFSHNNKLVKKIKKFKRIKELGSVLEFHKVDICDESETSKVINGLKNKYGRINGIIHCSGITNRENISDLNDSIVDSVTKAKVEGTWILNKVTKDYDMDFFVMFSSIITLIGSFGGSAYTCSNIFLDSFAEYMNLNGRNALTINWPDWNNTGMMEGVDIDDDKEIFEVINPKVAVQVFLDTLSIKENRIIVGKLNTKSSTLKLVQYLPISFSDEIIESIDYSSKLDSSSESKINVILSGRDDGKYSEIEKIISIEFANELGVGVISIYDDFYELGGDSIIALKVVNSINEKLNINIDITELLRYPNIIQFASYIDEVIKAERSEDVFNDNVQEKEESKCYPLSSAQKRLFILDQFSHLNTTYNLPIVMRLDGKLDKDLFEHAIYKLIERHETLRTSFEIIENEPMQKIHEEVNFKINYIKSSEEDLKNEIRKYIIPFYLKDNHLFRVTLIELSERKHIVIFDMHHIISDGVSIGILIREFSELYSQKVLPKLNVQYKDYVLWQKEREDNEQLVQQEKFWLDLFKKEVPELNLPLDYKRPVIQGFDGNEYHFHIENELKNKLNKLAMDTSCTLYMVLLAAYNILLHKYTGNEDIVVGSPVVGRNNKNFENVIGNFLNIVPMRNYPDGNKNFINFLKEIKNNSINAIKNQDYQFEDLVDKLTLARDTGRNPIFDTMFVLQNTRKEVKNIGNLNIVPEEFKNNISKLDITFEAIEKDDGIGFNIEYCTKLFKVETIKRISEHYTNILHSITNESNILIKDINILDNNERRLILDEFNNTEVEYENKITIAKAFERQVVKNPDRIATIFNGEKLTYFELNMKANQLARILIKNEIAKNDVVSIMLDRSNNMEIGILAILKAGAAYMPIVLNSPKDRIEYMLQDSGTSIIITDRELNSYIKFDGKVINICDVNLSDEEGSNLNISYDSRSLAYLIYTSGTTGKPKAVMVEQHSVINRIAWMQKKYPINEDDMILQKTTFTFDVSVWELLWWSFYGASVCFLEVNGEKDPKSIITSIYENKISVIHFVPSMLNVFIEYIEAFPENIEKLVSLKYVFTSGEALNSIQVQRFYNLFGEYDVKLNNLYGPTEATIDVIYYDCTKENILDNIPIGKPIDNTKIYIVDKFNNLQPMGIEGELCIAGVGVARGYYNKKELTKDKFVINPFVENIKDKSLYEIMYKTGDRARLKDDGYIEYLGRIDNQVKINGLRIELGEIESLLNKHEDIKEAAVIMKTEKSGSSSICAYLVLKNEVSNFELQKYLSSKLTDYMIPKYFVRIDKIPLSYNGKLDRKALAKFNIDTQNNEEVKKPTNKYEEKILGIWINILKIDNIGLDDKFFDIGGNSILLIKMHTNIEKLYPGCVDVVDLFKQSTIRKISNFIQEKNAKKCDNDKLVLGKIKLPEEYFVKGNLKSNSGVFKFKIPNKIVEEFELRNSYFKENIQTVLLAIFTQVLSQISNESVIKINTIIGKNGIIKIENDGNKSINDIINTFDKNYFSKNDIAQLNINKINSMNIRKEKNEVLTLLYMKNRVNTNIVLTKIYDIVFIIDKDNTELIVKCEYNNLRLKKEKIKELFNKYFQLVRKYFSE